MTHYIFTGRFQPLHKGHISFLEAARRLFSDGILIICILRNSCNSNDMRDKTGNPFWAAYREKELPSNNPLPNWNRYWLLRLATSNSEILNYNTVILFRNRPELNWEDSLTDLPDNRIWLMNEKPRDKGEIVKRDFYKSKGERIGCVPFQSINTDYSATMIRNKLKKDPTYIDFLPDCCHSFFSEECLSYFL